MAFLAHADAYHGRDDTINYDGTINYGSANKWRHQESSAFARQAKEEFLRDARTQQAGVDGVHQPLMTSESTLSNDNGLKPGMAPKQTMSTMEGALREPGPRTKVKCGPLLNYRRMDNGKWYGSVLVVTGGGEVNEPVLRFTTASKKHAQVPCANGEVHGTNGNHDQSNGVQPSNAQGEMHVGGVKLYADAANTFWRFQLEVTMQELEVVCQYTIPSLEFAGPKADTQAFHIPALNESMRIMFHSCNGFSVGTDEEAWSGAALWNDVRRVHEKIPFHVMLGGGDQIYNDGIRVNGPLRKWTDLSNPIKRREYPFPEELRRECDEYYVNNYIRWYSTEPFAASNGMIPQVNLWDDHDIIDGFGSYVDEFMRCSVFKGIGGVAHKYYLLFQHHLAPPSSTFTSYAPQSISTTDTGKDMRQMQDTYVLEEGTVDPSYVIGPKPGPYVAEHSRSIVTRLGARIAFFGIDARTERTRKQVNYPETYDLIFGRLRKNLSAAAASPSPIKHLVVLLGIPIAYPRLTWLENLFTSPIVAPIKFLNKRFGFGGGFFNHFDGNIDLLDDLDDHYTARTHKKERLYIVHQLQALATEYSVRVTILGGDVHLAAVGRFYSNPKLNIPIDQDHRYMANIISSAIVNKPPPQAVANLLARRNKLHHLDHHTDETLMKFFDKDPGDGSKTASHNQVTMPSRNWAMITENSPTSIDPTTTNGAAVNGNGHADATAINLPSPSGPPLKAKDGHSWLHEGETNAGTKHKAANSASHGGAHDGSLDVCVRVEINQHDKEGKTQSYGMTIPTLVYNKESAEHEMARKHHFVPGALNQRLHTTTHQEK